MSRARELPKRAGAGLAEVRQHPRHLVLWGLVAGLLVARAAPAVTLGCAAAVGALSGRSRVGALAAAAVLAGALVGSARQAALDSGVLAGLQGRTLAARATVLEPVRERVAGPAVTRVRLIDGPGAGEQAVVR